MANLTITVNRNGSQITLQPSGLSVPFGGPNPQTITWKPGPGIEITSIDFKSGRAPITPPKKQPDGSWKAEDTNDNTSGAPESWGYSITIDPEIVNEPQGGMDVIPPKSRKG